MTKQLLVGNWNGNCATLMKSEGTVLVVSCARRHVGTLKPQAVRFFEKLRGGFEA